MTALTLNRVESSQGGDQPLNVYLVDDQPLFLAGLTHVLGQNEGFRVVGQARSGEVALCELPSLPVDVVILEFKLGSGIDGLELCRRLSALKSSVGCLVLSSSADLKTLRDFRQAGAQGFLVKHAHPDQIVQGIKTVAKGGTVVDPCFSEMLIYETQNSMASPPTPRELETLHYAAAGLTNRAIAEQMLVSTGSVKAYLASLLRKLGARSRTDAVAIAVSQGLLAGPAPWSSDGPQLRAAAGWSHQPY